MRTDLTGRPIGPVTSVDRPSLCLYPVYELCSLTQPPPEAASRWWPFDEAPLRPSVPGAGPAPSAVPAGKTTCPPRPPSHTCPAGSQGGAPGLWEGGRNDDMSSTPSPSRDCSAGNQCGAPDLWEGGAGMTTCPPIHPPGLACSAGNQCGAPGL